MLVGKGLSKSWTGRMIGEAQARHPGVPVLVGTMNEARLWSRLEPEDGGYRGVVWPAFHVDVHAGRDDVLRDLEAAGVPVLAHPTSELRTAVRYPLGEVIARTGMEYFSHGVPLFLAWVLGQRPLEVLLPGCDYFPDVDRVQPVERQEVVHERPGAEWWMGYLHRHGVMVRVSPHSCLLTGHGFGRAVYAVGGAAHE